MESINTSAVPVSPAVLSGQTGTQKPNHGGNLFTFTVTAMDGGTSTYTLEVTKEELDTDPALSYLAVNPGYLSPPFNPGITSYTTEVESGVEEVIIDAELRTPTAKFALNYNKPGKYPVKTGENGFNFFVSAEDGRQSKIYSLSVTRKGLSTDMPEINSPDVYISNGVLYVNTVIPCEVSVYSVTDKLLYGLGKSAAFKIPVNGNEKILIVKGGSGWIKKNIDCQ